MPGHVPAFPFPFARSALVALACLLARAVPSRAGPPTASQPASAPSFPGAATAAASAPATSGDAAVDSILDRLEVKGRAIQGLTAQIEYNDIRFEPVEDKITKHGELTFRRLDPNSKFLIVFNETIAGGVKSDRKEHYLFDGEWFTERSERAKTIIKRQIVPKGKRIDPFKIGKGPFPLPFGQRRAEMLDNFRIVRKPAQPDDPPNCDHLHCEPRPFSELAQKYKRVEMYIDRRLELPVRIEVERTADDNMIDVRFSRLNPDAAPAASRFQIDRPPGPDWDVREEPLPEGAPEPPPPP